jgi:hypothetical protein
MAHLLPRLDYRLPLRLPPRVYHRRLPRLPPLHSRVYHRLPLLPRLDHPRVYHRLPLRLQLSPLLPRFDYRLPLPLQLLLLCSAVMDAPFFVG